MRTDRTNPSRRASPRSLRALRPVALALLALLALPLGAPAQTTSVASSIPASAAGRELVHATLRLRGNLKGPGGAYQQSDIHETADAELAEGQVQSVYAAVRGPAAGDDFLCMDGCGGAWKDPASITAGFMQSRSHVWWATLRRLPAPRMGQIALEVSWEHLFPGTDGRPVKLAGDTRRIELEEGKASVLDFLAEDTEHRSRCYGGIVVEIAADIKEDPAFVDRTIDYDLWLKHTDRDGVITTRKFQTSGRQGERREFKFAPMRFPVPGVAFRDGTVVESVLLGTGTVRGRLRPDGSIGLDVDLMREVGTAASGRPKTGGSGAGGRKEFSVAPGEAVSLALPPVAGGAHSIEDTSAPPTGAAGRRPLVSVNHPEFYAGARDEVIVTARSR